MQQEYDTVQLFLQKWSPQSLSLTLLLKLIMSYGNVLKEEVQQWSCS